MEFPFVSITKQAQLGSIGSSDAKVRRIHNESAVEF